MDALSDRPKIIVVCGPTASGKTGLSITLAKAFAGEVVSADSMQIYEGLDIGTAKVTAQEADGVPHHLINILTPDQMFSVADYVQYAGAAIADICARGGLPVICGGTGLYISSLVKGIDFTPQKTNPEVRHRLNQMWDCMGAAAMHQRLMEVDPIYGKGLHPNNKTRVLRALELYEQTGQRMSQQLALSQRDGPAYQALILYLSFSDRQALYRRIESRVDTMIADGLLDEAAYVFRNRSTFITAGKAIGYKEFFPYFEGTASLDSCIEKLKQASRNYAKRQITWFKAVPGAVPLAMDQPGVTQQALLLAEKFLS